MINVRQLIAKIYIKLGSGFVSNATTYKMRQEASCHNCISEGKILSRKFIQAIMMLRWIGLGSWLV